MHSFFLSATTYIQLQILLNESIWSSLQMTITLEDAGKWHRGGERSWDSYQKRRQECLHPEKKSNHRTACRTLHLSLINVPIVVVNKERTNYHTTNSPNTQHIPMTKQLKRSVDGDSQNSQNDLPDLHHHVKMSQLS